MIEINCPHCGHQLRIHEKFAGQRGGCKHCRGTFVVPKVVAQAPVSPPGRVPAMAPARPAPAAPQPAVNVPPHGVTQPGPNVPGPGALFWVVALLFSPAGLAWALTLPKGHPHKYGAVLVPSLLVFTMVVLAVSGTLMVVMGSMSETDPIVYTSSSTGLYYPESASNLPVDARRSRLSDAIVAGYRPVGGTIDEQTREKLGIPVSKLDGARPESQEDIRQEASEGKQVSFRGEAASIGVEFKNGKVCYVSTFRPIGGSDTRSLPRYMRFRSTAPAHPKDVAMGDVYDIRATLGGDEYDATLGDVVLLKNAHFSKVTDSSGAKR